jgi:F420H(2)-dependent quinone reductase
MSDWNKAIIDEFHANKGKVGGPFEGFTLLLVHTIGAKSGLERINPVMYLWMGIGTLSSRLRGALTLIPIGIIIFWLILKFP